MSSPFSVRFATRDDFEKWLPLWEGYNRFYGRSDATALPKQMTETTWNRFFVPSERMHALVAESQGELCGLAHYLFHRSTTMLAHTCYMQDLFTAESMRNTGVAKALTLAVYEQAKLAGSTKVYWQTHESNATAMSLYNKIAERLGFLVYRKQI